MFERPFLWQGDSSLLLGIVQSHEDRLNVEHDTSRVGVSVVILIEDSVRYYSSFLPKLYAELTKQSQLVISEGINLQNKLMRLRARPKILHCIDYEQAEGYYHRYRPYVLGIISDINFPRNRRTAPDAGLDFARMVRDHDPDLPIMLQTRDEKYDEKAQELRAALVLKGSPLLLHQLSAFMRDNFGFGDFTFQTDDGAVLGRARDLRGLEDLIGSVSDEVILRHAERNHFSTWLRARTEFRLAEDLRWPRTCAAPTDFESLEELRGFLQESIRRFRRERQLGVLSQFEPSVFEKETSFARIGSGSLGGKARGLAFVRRLLQTERLHRRFQPESECFVPSAVVLATGVFDRFLDHNQLRDDALNLTDDKEIEARFVAGRFSGGRLPQAPGLPEHRGLPARGPILEPAGGLALLPVHGRLQDLHGPQQPPGRRGAHQGAGAGRQARLRQHLLPAGQGLHRDHAVPARGGEDGGDPPAGRRDPPRAPVLPRDQRRGSLAQLLSRLTDAPGGRGRDRRAGVRPDGGRGRQGGELQPPLPPPPRPLLHPRGHSRSRPGRVLRPRPRGGRQLSGPDRRARAHALRGRDRARGRDAGPARLHVFAGEPRGL